ncbi:YceD family protein [Oceanobacillus locisalsi]|uniref:YceD family protein n=1 Tax=Oceanobacillus locisalsi TaxID=546107 RepID=A0ABW3NHP3_9BACI
MKLTVNQIKRGSVNEPYFFDDHADVSELETMNNDIRKISPVHVTGQVTSHGEEFYVNMHIKGEMILPCARTLVDVPYPFDIDANEVFSASAYYGKEEEEQEIHPIQGEVLDLLPFIKENVLLEIPYRVFADHTDQVDSEEAAPSSGKDWEFISETKEDKNVDPRLKKLESFLNNNQEEK